MDAYSWPWIAQKPAVIRISARKRRLVMAVAIPRRVSLMLRGRWSVFSCGRKVSATINSATRDAAAEK
jgi:hypothetical protein